MNSDSRAGAGPDPGAASPEDALRANVYSLLAALLVGPPSAELRDRLAGIERVEGSDTGAAMASAWETLRLAAERAQSLEALDDEYHALFIGVGRGELVPYGSWYLTGFLMDRPLAVLRRDLAQLGLERQAEVSEPEDHVAALCETMAIIIQSEDVSAAAQSRFFEDHVSPWMGIFFRDLQQARSARFYRAVGQLGEQFIELEKQYLSMLV